MTRKDHNVKELEGREGVYRCTECGLLQSSESAFDIYRCSSIAEGSGTVEEMNPPEPEEIPNVEDPTSVDQPAPDEQEES